MAGVEFDRQVFVPAGPPQGKSTVQVVGPLLLVLALGLLGFVGYKVYLVNLDNSSVTSANAEIQRLQGQLSETQKRLEAVEKHRRAPAELPDNQKASMRATEAPPPPSKTIYRIATASALPAQPKAVVTHESAQNLAAGNHPPELAGQLAANREAWEATTNRLADVVGTVGTQQGEITETREAINELLAQTRRQAISFELDKANNRVTVGPVTLQFKSTDTKAQRYTVCVMFNSEKCIELKDRALNEVVVFIVAKNTTPLELVATRIQHGQISGYVAIPVSMQ